MIRKRVESINSLAEIVIAATLALVSVSRDGLPVDHRISPPVSIDLVLNQKRTATDKQRSQKT